MYCRCSSDVQCEAYQHITSEQHGCNCVLVESVRIIHDQSQTFVSNKNQVINATACTVIVKDRSIIPLKIQHCI